MTLQIIPKRESRWITTTVEEARKFLNQTRVIWWRPNMEVFSKDFPDQDPAWLAEE